MRSDPAHLKTLTPAGVGRLTRLRLGNVAALEDQKNIIIFRGTAAMKKKNKLGSDSALLET